MCNRSLSGVEPSTKTVSKCLHPIFVCRDAADRSLLFLHMCVILSYFHHWGCCGRFDGVPDPVMSPPRTRRIISSPTTPPNMSCPDVVLKHKQRCGLIVGVCFVCVCAAVGPAMVILLSVCGVAAVLLLCLCVCLCKCFICTDGESRPQSIILNDFTKCNYSFCWGVI